MALTPWLQQQQEMQALLGTVEQEQAGPAATAPPASEVLEVIAAAIGMGFTVGSSIYGAVNAVNPQTGQIDTASGTVRAGDAGILTTQAPPDYRGVPGARHEFSVKENGNGWDTSEWLTPVNIALGVGGLVLIAMVTRR